MKRSLLTTYLTVSMAFATTGLSAQEDPAAATADAVPTKEQMQARREQWQSMTPEEQTAALEERRQRWESMSPEERDQTRQRVRAHRQEARERWQSQSPEEQARIREERRARRESLSPERKAEIREQRQERRHQRDGAGPRGGSQSGGGI